MHVIREAVTVHVAQDSTYAAVLMPPANDRWTPFGASMMEIMIVSC